MMKPFTMTKRQALEIYKKPGLLAKALGITPGFVSQWPLDEPMLDAYALRIRYELNPDCFDDDHNMILERETA